MLLAKCAGTVKRISMELGGNAPFIVFSDANIDQAVQAAMNSKFRHAGQTCVCSDRFLIHVDVFDEFVSKFKERVESQLVLGPGMLEGTTLGPMITSQAANDLHLKVQEAVSAGAQLVTGGTLVPEVGLNFYAPTILINVGESSRIWSTETFGPVAAIRSFQTDEEAIEAANHCDVGLAAYFCTQDLDRAFQISNRYVSPRLSCS
jgi:succinate-semialdehyde dehydrogenase / glutarate-semialdehyde dehydrogenase